MSGGPDRRRSLRLKGYDYAQAGAYSVALCTQDRACLFGEIVDGAMRLNDAGRMLQAAWDELPVHYPDVDIDTYVVRPNHVHGIVVVEAAPRGRPDPGQAQGPAATSSLPDVVHRFKTLTTKRYIDGVKTKRWPPFRGHVWQRNYYEHVVRDEASFCAIREYIANNPMQWALDRENPANLAAPRRRVPVPGQARGPAPTAWRDV